MHINMRNQASRLIALAVGSALILSAHSSAVAQGSRYGRIELQTAGRTAGTFKYVPVAVRQFTLRFSRLRGVDIRSVQVGYGPHTRTRLSRRYYRREAIASPAYSTRTGRGYLEFKNIRFLEPVRCGSFLLLVRVVYSDRRIRNQFFSVIRDCRPPSLQVRLRSLPFPASVSGHETLNRLMEIERMQVVRPGSCTIARRLRLDIEARDDVQIARVYYRVSAIGRSLPSVGRDIPIAIEPPHRAIQQGVNFDLPDVTADVQYDVVVFVTDLGGNRTSRRFRFYAGAHTTPGSSTSSTRGDRPAPFGSQVSLSAPRNRAVYRYRAPINFRGRLSRPLRCFPVGRVFIRLVRTYRGLGAPSGTVLRDLGSAERCLGEATVNSDGSFTYQLRGLAPGTYLVEAVPEVSARLATILAGVGSRECRADRAYGGGQQVNISVSPLQGRSVVPTPRSRQLTPGGGRVAIARRTTEGPPKVSLLRVTPISGLNPFDVRQVQVAIGGAGRGVVPLKLVTSVPRKFGLTASLKIDASGRHTLSAVPGTQPAALIVSNKAPNTDYDAGTGFRLVSRSVGNSVAANRSVRFVVQRLSDRVFFQITARATSVGGATTISGLSGYRCGTSARTCP